MLTLVSTFVNVFSWCLKSASGHLRSGCNQFFPPLLLVVKDCLVLSLVDWRINLGRKQNVQVALQNTSDNAVFYWWGMLASVERATPVQFVKASAAVCAVSLCTHLSVCPLCVWCLGSGFYHAFCWFCSFCPSIGSMLAHFTLYCHLHNSPLYLFNFSIKQARDNAANWVAFKVAAGQACCNSWWLSQCQELFLLH